MDIEHIDHIDGMRRHQVLIESAFPVEAAGMLKNLENKGDPWGMGEARRAEWMTELDFEVPVADGKIEADVEYLFWVGCAGALEDRAKKTTKAIASLLHTAGVKFAVLGPAETCTGDPARRIGNEFVFSMLAAQNIETLNEAAPKTIVASCPHCFNTIANEYPQLGGNYEVIHHTQLLARLVEQGKLKPAGRIDEKLTYHDPCFLGRHNKVFTPPRQILEAVPGVEATEMHRCKERGFCCGAGGARMWMEERIGKRINTERIEEALALSPDTISTSCPYCLVMLGDAVSAKKSSGEASETLEVVDVAQLLVRSVSPAASPAGPALQMGVPEGTVAGGLGQLTRAASRRALAPYPNGRRCPSPEYKAGSSGSPPAASPRSRYGQAGFGVAAACRPAGRRRIIQHDDVATAVVYHDSDVAGPAGGPQDVPGRLQVPGGYPGAAPQPYPLAEVGGHGVEHDR